VAHAGSDTSIVLTDTENWQEIRRLTGHAEEPHDVAWHPDGDYLASIDFGTIRIWDTTDGQQEAVFNINTASLYPSTVSWNVDGNLLAATIDDRIEVWDIQAQQMISSLNTGGVITGMDWHPNGTILYTTSTVESFVPTPTALITNVAAANGKAYARDVLNVGSTVYIDRTYTYTVLPPELVGRDYIRTAIEDRQLTTIDFLTFTLTADAEVYVLWDSRFVIPNWLRGWTNTGLTVTTTDFNNTTLNRFVYRRFYPRGTVVLGANRSANNSTSYMVAAVPRSVNVIYRIDAGGGGYTSPSGVVWQADAHFTGGQANNFPTAVQNTADDALYTTERSSVSDTTGFSYALPVTNGTYTVRLHFAEIWFVGGSGREPSGSGQRVFDVQIEGATVLDNFDITASVGHAAATVRTFEGITVSDGALNLNFPPATADRPTIEAIEVWRE
jgi:hypothetical protein